MESPVIVSPSQLEFMAKHYGEPWLSAWAGYSKREDAIRAAHAHYGGKHQAMIDRIFQ
jgi:hypothetical protein